MEAPNDVVTHYGVGKTLVITAVASSSFHEKGSWQAITLTSGNLVIETGSFVGEVTKNGGTLENNGVIAKAISGTDASAGITGTGITNIISSDTSIKVGNAETLMNLAMAQSTGVFGDVALNIELTADINLTGRTWIPFGAKFTPEVASKHYRFSGVFDGKNHKIIGLNNGDYYGAMSTNSSGVTGDTYGFIAYTLGDVEVKNLTFEAVNINASNAKICGVVIGDTSDEGAFGTCVINNQQVVAIKYYTDSLKLTNVNVNGTVNGKDKVAGLIGYTRYMKPSTSETTASIVIDSCNVNANLTASGSRAGGLIGHLGDGSQVEVKNSSVSGEVKSADVYNGNLFGRADGNQARLKRFIIVTNFSANATTSNIKAGNTTNENDKNGNYIALKNTAGKKLGATRTAIANEGTVENTFTLTLDENEGVDGHCGFYEQFISTGIGVTTYINANATSGIYITEGLNMDYTVNSNNVIQNFVIYSGTFYNTFNPVQYIPGRTNETLTSNGSITIGEYTITRASHPEIGCAVYTVTKNN